MGFQIVQWTDRQSQFPTRRKLTAVSGQTDVYDISREEGNVTAEGSVFNANAINGLERRIAVMGNEMAGNVSEAITLSANSWQGHLITLNIQGVTADSNQEILGLPATSASNIQNNQALQEANIMDYGQASGSITLYAENVPEVDLYIRVIIRTKTTIS